MTVNSANSNAAQAAAIENVAKPLNELSQAQRKKVTSELVRIHNLVSNAAEKDAHKDKHGDKADRLI